MAAHGPADTQPRPKAMAKAAAQAGKVAKPRAPSTQSADVAGQTSGTNYIPGRSSGAAAQHMPRAKAKAKAEGSIHVSHSMRHISGSWLRFCNVCGLYVGHRTRQPLREGCAGSIVGTQGSKVSQLRNKRAGCHPVTGIVVRANVAANRLSAAPGVRQSAGSRARAAEAAAPAICRREPKWRWRLRC